MPRRHVFGTGVKIGAAAKKILSYIDDEGRPQGMIVSDQSGNAEFEEFEVDVSGLAVEIDDNAEEYGDEIFIELVRQLNLNPPRNAGKIHAVISDQPFRRNDADDIRAQMNLRSIQDSFRTYGGGAIDMVFPYHTGRHWQVLGLRIDQNQNCQIHLFDSSTETDQEGGQRQAQEAKVIVERCLHGFGFNFTEAFYHRPYRQSGRKVVEVVIPADGRQSEQIITDVVTDKDYQTSDCGVYAMQTIYNIAEKGFDQAAQWQPSFPDVINKGKEIVALGAQLRAEHAVKMLINGANAVEGVLNIQDLKDRIALQMVDERSVSPIELQPEREDIFDDLMQQRVIKILGGSSDNAVYSDLKARKDDIVTRCTVAFPEAEEEKAEYCLTDDQVSQATQFFIGKDALVINRSHFGQVDNLEDVVEIIENAEIGPDKIITFSYRNGFHFMSVVIDVQNKNINFTNSFEDKDRHYVNEFVGVAENRGLYQVLDHKFGGVFLIMMTAVEERVVQDEASEENDGDGDSTTCGVHAILNNSIGVLRARYGDEFALPMIKTKMREILGVEVEGESLQDLMLNAKEKCFSIEELKSEMKERAVCAAEISQEILQSGIYPKSTTAAYLQTVVEGTDAEATKHNKRNNLVATLRSDIEILQSDTATDYKVVSIALEEFENLYCVDPVRTIWQQQLNLTPSLNITGIENVQSAYLSKQHFFISEYATEEDLELGMKVKNILEPFLEADVDYKENRLKAIAALQESQVLQDEADENSVEFSQRVTSLKRASLAVIPEVNSRGKASNDSSETLSTQDATLSRTNSGGSLLSSTDKKASQAPSKELRKIWEEDGVTKRNIKNPLPSTSVAVVTAVLMKVPTVEKSAFYDKDRGYNYKTIEGAYSEDESERAKEVAEIMAFILSKIAYDPIAKRKNGGKNLTKEQLLGIIDDAKENGGVGSKINKGTNAAKYPCVVRKEAEISKALEQFSVKADVAIYVSGKYQEQCRLCGILSGYEDSNEGSRINFLTPQAREILADAVESDGKIKPKVGENTPQARESIGYGAETVGHNTVKTVIEQKMQKVGKLTGLTR